MKKLIRLPLLLIILFVAISCDQLNQDNVPLEKKLEGLKLATTDDLVRLGELELNSSNVPVYNTDGKRYSDDELLETLETNEYVMDYYLDKDEKLGAVVLRKLEASETEKI